MTGEHAYDELAVGYALHALEPEDEAEFVRHLAGCERCARTIADTSEAMAAMARDLPAAEPSPGLRERLRAAVETTEQVPPRPAGARAPVIAVSAAEQAGPQPVPLRRRAAGRPVLTRVLAAAAVAAVLGLGGWTVALSQSRDDLRSTVAAQEQVVAELTEPGTSTVVPLSTGERDVATVVVREDGVRVVTDGLSRNDASSEIYVLWGLGEEAPVPLGEFDVAGSQIGVETVGSGATGNDFSGYGISIEPGRQAPSAPTEVVATGQVTS
ncbi:anti-sigma factor [Blastococcus saxobsidens]|uniref:Regulator of SigK n=1 Tax=Blastococcus saxobsidens TaxID=138336 RepID=A0A6L9VXA5_9ACTN|nr:anti-sigma factor [Blastococcus saxobsidens]NEK84387.1 anti-sigma factor [Blastococcus saxobsidens]